MMLCRLPVAAVLAAAALSAAAGQPVDDGTAPARDGPGTRPARNGTGTGPAAPPDGGAHVSLDSGGLEITSADGRYSFGLGGRLHVDWTRHSGDSPPLEPIDGTDLRRARIGVDVRLDDAWRFSGETDFAGNEVSIKDFWLAYQASDGLRLTVGHQKQPYSHALETSSNDLPFVERGVDTALIAPFVDRAIGVRADAAGGGWLAAAGIYGESVEDDDEGWGAAGRFVLAPIADERRVLHVGIRAAYRQPDSASAGARIRDETTSFSDLSIVDTALIGGVDRVTLLGPEAAFASGPFSVGGEYTRARIDRALGNAEFDSWHVAATWSLTGESRAAAYAVDDGEFKRLEPAERFSRGNGVGAWELAARYASIDLSDDSLAGGKEKTISLAANWYANRNVRLMLDWTRVLQTDESSAVRAAAEGLNIFTLRAQYAF